MYDYFNMSCLDDKSALRLNIKVNSENLLPSKYNVGSLRVPADPSWPKIPPRKLADDAGDIIQPPCVITLTGNPKRSLTMVRTTQCQSFKSMELKELNSSAYRLQIPSTDKVKKRPGCTDPRFKRVTSSLNQSVESSKQNDNLKGQEKSTLICEQLHFSNKRIEKTDVKEDSNIQQITQQGTGKPKNDDVMQDNNSHFTQKHINGKEKTSTESNNYKSICNKQHILDDNNVEVPMDINNTSTRDVLNMKENVDPVLNKSKNILETKVPIQEEILNSTCNNKVILETNTRNDLKMALENQTSQLVNESDGQILLVMEKQVKSSSIKKVQVKPQYTAQCYNVQVPIITYQNVPLQISTCTSGEINISPCIANNISPISDMCTITQREEIYKSSNDLTSLPEKENFSQQKKEVINTKNTDIVDVQNKPNALVLSEEKEEKILEQPISEKNNSETYPDNENFWNSSKDHFNVTKNLISAKVTEYNKNTLNDQQKIKSEQNLTQTENLESNNLFQPLEPCFTSRKRRIRGNFSKKAKSFFQKRSRCGIVSSDCTLIWPGYQQVHSKCGFRLRKVRQYMKEKNCHCSISKKSVNEKNSNINMNSTAMISKAERPITSPYPSFNDSFYYKKGDNEYNSLQRTNKNYSIENPIRIPLKTQELLNKSYLEYYNKLKQKSVNTKNVHHQVILGTPKIKKKKSKQFCDIIYNHETEFNPEVKTIEQCSALSSMINKNLNSALQHSSDTVQTKQIYLNRNIRSSSDPTGGTQSKVIKNITSKIPADIYENSITSSTFINKVKHKRNKCIEKRFHKLKTIVFFGSMMYALVVFLPMLYDYFFYEDYDDYENLTYIELIMDYVISSFKEAFNGFFNALYKIFFQPHACKKCNSVS